MRYFNTQFQSRPQWVEFSPAFSAPFPTARSEVAAAIRMYRRAGRTVKYSRWAGFWVNNVVRFAPISCLVLRSKLDVEK